MKINQEQLVQEIFEHSLEVSDTHLKDRIRYFVNVWDSQHFFQEQTGDRLREAYTDIYKIGVGNGLLDKMSKLIASLD